MSFWICVGTVVIALFGVIMCYYFDCEIGILLTGILAAIAVITTATSIAIIIGRYSCVEADVAKYQKKYESLTYQYENNFYNNDNEIGKYELMRQIEAWNTDLAYKKEMKRNFWVGIYWPNIYDDFEFISLVKEAN